jgi:hypothetical protein
MPSVLIARVEDFDRGAHALGGEVCLALGHADGGVAEQVADLRQRDLPRGDEPGGAGVAEVEPFIAVLLDCIDDHALSFYRQWDFQPLPGYSHRLFLRRATLEAMMPGG